MPKCVNHVSERLLTLSPVYTPVKGEGEETSLTAALASARG